MAKLEGIFHGINSVGSNLPEKYGQSELPFRHKQRKDRPEQLRKGEIIQGTIVGVPDEKAAIVRLPIGTFTAYLQGRLKKGDTLYFQVADTEPSLILKIYSTSFKVNGVDLPTPELVRILDLPDTKFYHQFIAFSRFRLSTITREEALQIGNAYGELGNSAKKETGMELTFRILQFMLENNVNVDTVNFMRLKPVFLGPNVFHESLLEFEKNIGTLPDSIKPAAENIIRELRQPSMSFPDIIRFFAKKEIKNKSASTFYNLLADIITRDATHSASGNLLKSARDIISIVESQNFINKIAITDSSYHYMYIPVILSGIYFIALFEAKNILADRKMKAQNFNNIYRISKEEILNIIKKQTSNDNAGKHGLFTQSAKACELLAGYLNSIISELSKWHFESRTITVSHFPAEEFVINLKNPIKQPKNFSIVV